MAKLLLPYAYDSDDSLVWIEDAQTKKKYRCPNCGSELLLKISKIPQGQKNHRRSHFAHKANPDNHCSESFLHKLFKERCVKYISDKILVKQDLPFDWQCHKCGEKHHGNLLKKAVTAIVEYDMTICKPDIALLDSNGNVIIVIEVVVTHKPEPSVLQYYEDNNIACVQINVDNFADCDNVVAKLTSPSRVNKCPNPICNRCGMVMNSTKLITVNANCDNCNQKMKIAMIMTPENILGPGEFNPNKIEMAKRMGANIDLIYDEAKGEKYYANKCVCCQSYIGNSYMDEFRDNSRDKEQIISYICQRCHREVLCKDFNH